MLILTAPLSALCIFVVIHFHQHYRFLSSDKKHQSLHCCGCLSAKSDQAFGFFPIAFLLYMLLITVTSVLIICRYSVHERLTFTLSIYGNNLYPFTPSANTFTQTTSLHMTHSYLDWSIYCLILLSMLWESLFSFYRFYSTKMLIQCLYDALTFTVVLKRFTVYAALSIVLFVIQTQLYYYLFPVLILSYLIPNLYWIVHTSRFIIESVEKNSNDRFNHDSDLVNNTIFMRNLTVLSSICSSIYLTMFTTIYTMDIVYYLPFIWSVSLALFFFNFVRNRQYIKSILSRIVCKPVPTQSLETIEADHVENMDRDKPPVRLQILDQMCVPSNTPNPMEAPVHCSTRTVPISLPSIHEIEAIGEKSHSTGNLFALLQKKEPVMKKCEPYLTPLVPLRESEDGLNGFPEVQFTASHSETIPSIVNKQKRRQSAASSQVNSSVKMQFLATPSANGEYSFGSMQDAVSRCLSSPILERDYEENTSEQYDFSSLDSENPTPVPLFNVGSLSVPIDTLHPKLEIVNSKPVAARQSNHLQAPGLRVCHSEDTEKSVEPSMSKSFLDLFAVQGFYDHKTY
eukprot:655610_1